MHDTVYGLFLKDADRRHGRWLTLLTIVFFIPAAWPYDVISAAA